MAPFFTTNAFLQHADQSWVVNSEVLIEIYRNEFVSPSAEFAVRGVLFKDGSVQPPLLKWKKYTPYTLLNI